MWFAVPYVAVRVLGMGIYFVVTGDDRDQLSGMRMCTVASIPGMVVVLAGGLVEPGLRAWLWLVAVVLDIAATGLAGSYGDWRLRSDHFSERHGLFVIIAPCVSVIETWVTLGMRATGSHDVLFEDVRVPATAVGARFPASAPA